ncbi:MAG TPA: peptidylprolyl isomerase [Vicinamibacteria bacterium]|jgi:peptidyl-prolyl cis-trans isomerase C|nr:peptidylprolyl isomerase [Vicinamibacteria bacterium]
MAKGCGWAWVGCAVLAASCSGSPPKPSPTPSAPPSGGPPEIDRVTPLPSPLPDIVARVNGQPVQLGQVVTLAKKALDRSQDREKDKPGALRQAMHQYIIRELLLQEALARGLAADQHRLEQAYDKARLDYRDETQWASELAQRGLDPQAFKYELRAQETVNALVAQEAAKVGPVTDAEALVALTSHPETFTRPERLRLRHILVRVASTASRAQRKQQRERAEELHARARRGEDFAGLAQQFSDDLDSRPKGGQLPEIGRGAIEGAFDDAAFALKPGQISDVVESPAGFHIIKLEARLPAEPASFPRDQDAVKQYILQQRRGEALQALVNTLRAKARIETYL